MWQCYLKSSSLMNSLQIFNDLLILQLLIWLFTAPVQNFPYCNTKWPNVTFGGKFVLKLYLWSLFHLLYCTFRIFVIEFLFHQLCFTCTQSYKVLWKDSLEVWLSSENIPKATTPKTSTEQVERLVPVPYNNRCYKVYEPYQNQKFLQWHLPIHSNYEQLNHGEQNGVTRDRTYPHQFEY